MLLSNNSDFVVNLSNCDREPIHIPNSIQPHGFMLVVDSALGKIIQASDNISKFIPLSSGEVLNTSLDTLFSQNAYKSIIAETQNNDAKHFLAQVEFNAQFKTVQTVDLTSHRINGYLVIECEPCTEREIGASDKSDSFSKDLIQLLSHSRQKNELFQCVIDKIYELTSYDRIMIYQFDELFNGTVIAERKTESLESFLGLHYPATDIPVQARELYKKKMIRIIPDVSYTPVAFMPNVLPNENGLLDMSLCNLRSVSPIHIEYLQNMGVAATLTISVLKEERLWGLIACHHGRKKLVGLDIRKQCELIGQAFGELLSLEEVEEDKQEQLLKTRADSFMEIFLELSSRYSIEECFKTIKKTAPQITESDGFAYVCDQFIVTEGATPKEHQIRSILSIVDNRLASEIFFTASISELVGSNIQCDSNCAGIAVVRIWDSPNEYLVWFRLEHIHTIRWAGDPQKAAGSESVTGKISPRTSFEEYKQTVGHTSNPWSKSEQHVLEHLKRFHSIMATCKSLQKEKGEKLHYEREVERQKEYLYKIIDTLPSLISIQDNSGRFTQMNKKCADFYNDQAKNLVGKKKEECESLYERNYNGAEQWDENQIGAFEEEYTNTENGQKIYFHRVSVPIDSPSGDEFHILSIATDITELKNVQAEKEEQEHMMIHQSRLAIMGEMVSMIAHQWRQPLTAVVACATNINILSSLGKLDNKELEESLKRIVGYSNKMSATINDFMNFFKPTKSKEFFAIKEIVVSTLNLLEAQLQAHNIDVKVNIDERVRFFGYKNELEQVLLNIIANARDALEDCLVSDETKREIVIEAQKIDDKIDIHVGDNAGGIEEWIIERIFDPYFTTKPQGKGTGVGLYMSKMIIQRSFDGELSATNIYKDGKRCGVSFCISLIQKDL